MPVIKSAIKKLRQDRVREKRNDGVRQTLKLQIKKATRDKKQASMNLAFSLIDKAKKDNIIHKNKAARLKAALAKNIKKEVSPKAASPVKKSSKKVVATA